MQNEPPTRFRKFRDGLIVRKIIHQDPLGT